MTSFFYAVCSRESVTSFFCAVLAVRWSLVPSVPKLAYATAENSST